MLTNTIHISKLIILPLHRNSIGYLQCRKYARKLTLTDYNVVWNAPEKLPLYDPKKSSDLRPFHSPDVTRPVLELQRLTKKINECDEITKKLLSIEFAPKDEILNVAKNDAARRVQNHQFDFSSYEVQVAQLTEEIRYYQKKFKSPEGLTVSESVNLNQIVGKREQLLKKLRVECYKKFEWILDQLNIIYRAYPRVTDKITRKLALRRLIDMRYSELKEKRLQEYKDKLHAEKEPFLKEKLEVLKWISDTEKELGLPVSVDVWEAEQQLKNHLEVNQ